MALTLAQLRDLTRVHLRDAAASVWSDSQVEDAIRAALDDYNQVSPRILVGTITLASDGREISLSSLALLLDVLEVWLPYTASSPEEPPNRRSFWMLNSSTLYVEGDEPGAGDVARVRYTARHTVDGLDSAVASTVPAHHERNLAVGAAFHAGAARTRQLTEMENVPAAVRYSSRRVTQDWADRWFRFLGTLGNIHSGIVAWDGDS